MRLLPRVISLIYFIYSVEAFTQWTDDGPITKIANPDVEESTLSTGKKIKFWRQNGNYMQNGVRFVDMAQSYFDIQQHCEANGMQVFLPSNQAETDEMVALIPNTLSYDNITLKTTEDIYSGLYIRMSDMDYEGCWKTTGTNGVDHPFSKMFPGTNCPIQAFPHIVNNAVLDDGYDNQSGEDFMMLTPSGEFHDVSHMVSLLDGTYSATFLETNPDWNDDELETPHKNAWHGLLRVCEDKSSPEPCAEADYADYFCAGFQKDLKAITGAKSYDDAVSSCGGLGIGWDLWYPESKEEETTTFSVMGASGPHWVRDQGTFQCRYNPKGEDPHDSVSDHYVVSNDNYKLLGYDGASTHSVICEKVQDQYKTEREVCDSSYVPPVVGDVPVTNTAGTTRNLTYIGKTTYQRAHAICEAKGKQMFLPRDLGEMNDVYKIFYNNTPTKEYFETTDYQELIKRPSMWIRYTDQDHEHCWETDDACSGGMKWTAWAYRWFTRKEIGYYPKGEVLQNTYLDDKLSPRYWLRNTTQFLHQPDNWGVTKSKLVAYARRFNEYGQQYAAVEGTSALATKPAGANWRWKPHNRDNGYPDHGILPYYGLMHDTYNVYNRGFGFCEEKGATCEEMNIIEHGANGQCLSRSMLSNTVEKLATKMTYAEGKAACAAKDMIIWMPDNVVEQNTIATDLNLAPDDEVWLRLSFADGTSPSCSSNGCTTKSCCCPSGNEDQCTPASINLWKSTSSPGESGVGTWRIDWADTNSINPEDPGPPHDGVTSFTTDPPSCRSTAPFYHWATDEPRNFKAIGKQHRNPTAAESANIYAVYSHSKSGISPGTSKDNNGDWVSKSGTDTAWVLCQTRDYFRHKIIKRCDVDQ